MKSIFTLAAVAALALTSCGGNAGSQSQSTANDSIAEAKTSHSIVGKWNIDNVVMNDSVSARPAADAPQFIDLTAEGAYNVQTNCNSIQGNYTTAGDSITFEAGLMTEMACDNMEVEDLIKQILPNVIVADFENDSIVRLNTATPSQYIMLSKSK